MNIGDIVRNAYGIDGQIVEIYPSFYHTEEPLTMTKQDWLQAQIIPISKEELSERWFEVHLFNGGAILSPESRLEFIDTVEI